MAKNNDYITAHEIYNRVARTHKRKIEEFGISDFIEWCAEVETEHICETARMKLYKAVRLGDYDSNQEVEDDRYTIVNGQVLTPSNVWRLLDVMSMTENTETRLTGYYYDGTYIRFDDNNIPDNCYINYMGIAVDPITGYPYILLGHENACYYYCLMKMYEEDAGSIPTKVNLNTYQSWELNFDVAVRSAKSSFRYMDREDMRQLQLLMVNMYRHPGKVPLFKLDK